MPHSFNANWIAATAQIGRVPNYFVRFAGLDDRQYSVNPVRGATRTTFPLLTIPDAVGQKTDQLRGRSTLSLTKLRIVDHDADFSNVIATERPAAPVSTMVNRRVELFSGYQNLQEGDYERIVRGQIASLEMSGETYELKLVDFKRHEFDNVFTNAEASSIQKIDTTISVQTPPVGTEPDAFSVIDPTGIEVEDKLFLGPNSSGQTEKIEVREVNGSSVRTLEPLTLVHQVGTAVRWATTFIEGNPVNIFYAVMTGDFANASFPLIRADGLPTGLGIDPLDLATADLINERDNFYADEIWAFEIKRETPGFRFLESKIFRFLGFPYVSADGRLAFRMFRPAYAEDAEAGLGQFTKDEIKAWKWERAHKLHVNRVKLGLDLNPETGKPPAFETLEDEVDQIESGETVEIEEEDTGIRVRLRGARLAEERAQVLLRRFLPPPVQLRVSCDMRLRETEVGDVVEVTHPAIPNMDTGQRGLVGVRFEVVERNEGFASERVEFVLQDAGFERPAFIAPDSAPDYDSATDAEKEFCYISANGPPLALNMTGGRPFPNKFPGYDNVLGTDFYPSVGYGPDADITLGYVETVGTLGSIRGSPNSPDARYDSNHGVAQSSRIVLWIALPNGNYRVWAVGGDPVFETEMGRFDINGVVFWDTTVILTPPDWIEARAIVPVTDGRMIVTLRGKGSTSRRTFYNFLEIDLGASGASPFPDGGNPYEII